MFKWVNKSSNAYEHWYDMTQLYSIEQPNLIECHTGWLELIVHKRIIEYQFYKSIGIVLLKHSTMRPNSILYNAYPPERYKIESGSLRS